MSPEARKPGTPLAEASGRRNGNDNVRTARRPGHEEWHSQHPRRLHRSCGFSGSTQVAEPGEGYFRAARHPTRPDPDHDAQQQNGNWP